MNVAIVCGVDPDAPKPGGTRAYAVNLTLKLLGMGIGVTFYGVYLQPTIRDVRFLGYKPIVRGKEVSSNKFLLNLLFKTPLLEMSNDVVIHAQRPDNMFPFALFKRKNPKICTMHGMPSMAIKERKGKVTWTIYDFLERFSLKRSDRIIFVDSRAEELYLKRYEWLKGKTRVIPVGIDLNEFKPKDKNSERQKYGFSSTDKIILFAGRLEWQKRVDLLIKVFKEISKEIKAKLIIVGEGSKMDTLKALAGNSRIQFLGTLPRNEVPDIINCADVLALCSEYEGMPTIVLETLACGIPVVSTDVGDARKAVLNGKTGYLAERNIDDLKEKLLMVLEDSERFKHNCLEMAKQYSWDIIAERTLNVYKEVYDEVF